MAREVLRREAKLNAHAALDAHRFEQLFSRLLELPEAALQAQVRYEGDLGEI